MKNLGQLMKQAQEMQNRMQEMQQKLAEIELEGTSAGGMVKVTVNGRSEMRRVKIDPALVDPKEVEVLEDLVVAAFNDAKAKVEARVAEEMQKLTGGLPLPPASSCRSEGGARLASDDGWRTPPTSLRAEGEPRRTPGQSLPAILDCFVGFASSQHVAAR